MIKISKARAYSNGIIEVEYVDGIKGSFLYSDYFNFNGLLAPLKDKKFFTMIKSSLTLLLNKTAGQTKKSY